MADIIEDELEATGVAPVICILKAPTGAAAATASTVKDLSSFFTSSELSQESAITRAAQGPGGFAKHRVMRARARHGRGAIARLDTRAAYLERPKVANADVPEATAHPLVRFYPNLGVALGTVNREGLDALRKEASVDQVVGAPRFSLIRPTRARRAALRAQMTWGIRRIRANRLWDQGLTGKGVLIGHLDTGVDGTHPALRGAISSFAEFDLLGSQLVPDPDPYDTGDHGTHTAATIAGRPQKNRHLGVAPGAVLASAIVIENGQVVARVLGGMDWAVGQGVRILSMSLGLPGWWAQFLAITDILRQRGILPVFAVGNEGPGTSRSPGNYANVLSVGAMDDEGDIAPFSSSQRFTRENPVVPNVVAPGYHVISARPGGGYRSLNGTSMATPHVAGLAALLLQAKPAATVDELENAILMSAALEPSWPRERAGLGVPDAERALQILIGA